MVLREHRARVEEREGKLRSCDRSFIATVCMHLRQDGIGCLTKQRSANATQDDADRSAKRHAPISGGLQIRRFKPAARHLPDGRLARPKARVVIVAAVIVISKHQGEIAGRRRELPSGKQEVRSGKQDVGK